jgi:glucosamine kinase
MRAIVSRGSRGAIGPLGHLACAAQPLRCFPAGAVPLDNARMAPSTPALPACSLSTTATETMRTDTTAPYPSVEAGGLGLGLDVGGTHTRWSLTDAAGQIVGEGRAPGWTALSLADAAGRAAVQTALAALLSAARRAAEQAPPGRSRSAAPGLPQPTVVRAIGGVFAGITGFDSSQLATLSELFRNAWINAAAGLASSQAIDRTPRGSSSEPAPPLQACNDIELVCRNAFGTGEAGGVVYAGTGSVAAWLDAAGTLHRAGGRGGLIDDAGGGHWIARQALACVWRAEDAAPGSTADWPLARALAAHIGGADWVAHRRWVYAASRGELGRLALAVAASAPADPRSRQILAAAGQELGRLAQALLRRRALAWAAQPAREGTAAPWPLALAGRAFELHPLIETTLRAALPPGQPVRRAPAQAERTAARLAIACWSGQASPQAAV